MTPRNPITVVFEPPPTPVTLRAEFARRFAAEPVVIARAPGRVNLIGEHTDYNDGFVLPMALTQSTWAAVAPRDDGRIRAVSPLTPTLTPDEWTLDQCRPGARADWARYVAGVAGLLREAGAALRGFDLLIESDVPVGAGLSSSAALEVATGLALTTLARHACAPQQLIDLCRRAEHEFAGVPCGVMDQTVAVLARPGTALLLDCRSREYEHLPLPREGLIWLIIDSGVRHELADGGYAARLAECRTAAAHFARVDPAWASLRDVPPAAVPAHAVGLESAAAARARHVCSENVRVLAFADALRRGDVAALGPLLNASHASLRDDFAVSCPEIEDLVRIVKSVPGVCGARMTGGGFGGSVVALARPDAATTVEQAVRESYRPPSGTVARLRRAEPGGGASVEQGAP